MPTRRQLIQKITLNADSSSVTFSNIPQNYTDLRIVASARSSQSAASTNMRMTFNGSSSGYSERVIYGDSVGAASYANTSVSLFTIGLASAATSTANTFGYIEINIPNYTSSNNKSLISKYTSENNSSVQNTAYIGQLAGLWANTSSISSITFTLASGNYLANSTFYLYGITHVPIIRGGTVTVPGDGFKYHTFRSSGSLQVIEPGDVEYLIVAGGGGGGRDNWSASRAAGGGGAGGLLNGKVKISNGINAITVGGGGVGGISDSADASNGGDGSNSMIGSLISIGGGGGGGHGSNGNNYSGRPGGSGGGNANNAGPAGSGTTGQGNSGGVGYSINIYTGGGGGGANTVGGAGNTSISGSGGAGRQVWGTFYSGGGGAWGTQGGATPGGIGGGGAGGSVPGTTNTGGGGGGNRGVNGGAGGSGIVIIRYPYDGN